MWEDSEQVITTLYASDYKQEQGKDATATCLQDFPGGPVLQTLPSWIKPMQEAWVLSRECLSHAVQCSLKKKRCLQRSFNINIVRTDSKIQ